MTVKKEVFVRYNIGEAVPEDDGTAVKWYTKAAEQGGAMALNLIWGLCMPTGEKCLRPTC